jgi:hypothetical protein
MKLNQLCGAIVLVCASSAWSQMEPDVPQPAGPFHLYPQEIVDALLLRKQAEQTAFYNSALPGAYSFIASNRLWQSGDKLIVAFHGGDYVLWKAIADIANLWTKEANISFDFGFDDKKKTARTWNPGSPVAVSAHVKIRLDVDNALVRYSAVGRDAFLPEFATGTMVLGGVAIAHPLWSKEDRADILHEFGHVLGFLHEQQRSECVAEFRTVTGPHGEPTLYDVYQQVYKKPPEWTKKNFELSASYQVQGSDAPDKRSLFMYPTLPQILPATFHGKDGPCYTGQKNLAMSAQDRARARQDYPFSPDNLITNLASGNVAAVKQLLASAGPLAASPLVQQRLENIERALRPQVYIQIASE